MKLIILFWTDTMDESKSHNVFAADSSRDIDSFIEWKESKGYVLEKREFVTREEYQLLLDNTSNKE